MVSEQLRWVDPVGQGGRLGILAADGEGEVGPLGGGAPGPVGVGGHRDLLPGSDVELSEPIGLRVGQRRPQAGHTNRPASSASGDGHRVQRTLNEYGSSTPVEPDKARPGDPEQMLALGEQRASGTVEVLGCALVIVGGVLATNEGHDLPVPVVDREGDAVAEPVDQCAPAGAETNPGCLQRFVAVAQPSQVVAQGGPSTGGPAESPRSVGGHGQAEAALDVQGTPGVRVLPQRRRPARRSGVRAARPSGHRWPCRSGRKPFRAALRLVRHRPVRVP